MNIDPILSVFVGIAFLILIISIFLRSFQQPYVIAYIIAGIFIGPVLGLVTNENLVSSLGTIGVVLLLFFVGIEISLPKLLSNWRVAIFGTFFQILISVAFVLLIGVWLKWSLERIILLGFVISLSSTAVVVKILQDMHEMNTKIGQNVMSILLVQDLAVIPMLIVLNLLGGKAPTMAQIYLQLIGGLAIIGFVVWIIYKRKLSLPFSKFAKNDREMQVFAALLICFGLAFITGLVGLSTALGAFIAGIVVSITKETHWVSKSLEPFYVVFVAIFFVSIGMLIDIAFIIEHIGMVILLVVIALIINTFINAIVFRFLGDNWKESFYSGALLSQIGEFSFVLGAIGFQSGIITEFGYKAAIAVISITFFLSPLWISLIKKHTIKKNII